MAAVPSLLLLFALAATAPTAEAPPPAPAARPAPAPHVAVVALTSGRLMEVKSYRVSGAQVLIVGLDGEAHAIRASMVDLDKSEQATATLRERRAEEARALEVAESEAAAAPAPPKATPRVRRAGAFNDPSAPRTISDETDVEEEADIPSPSDAMRDGAAAGAGSTAAAASSRTTAASAAEEQVYVTRTGTKYHRASCSHLTASAMPMSLREAAGRYGPCAACAPPVPGNAGGGARGLLNSSSAPRSTQCAATTKKGTRCSRMASAGSAYCWQHAR